MVRRSGFTLTEIVVTVAVIAILAAIVTPTIMSRLAVGRGNAMAAELSNLGLSLRAFRTNLGTYPANLSDLAGVPGSPQDYCGLTINATTIAQWRGPYTSRFITGDYVLDNSTIVNQMTYTAGPPAYLQISVNNVPTDLARAIEEALDGPVTATSFTTGSFTYASPNAIYRIPVPAC